jgi:multiple sugar transport system substrate-binding protein
MESDRAVSEDAKDAKDAKPGELTRRTLLKRTGAAGLAVAAGGLIAAPAIGTSKSSAQEQVSGELSLAYLGTADQQKAWEALFALFAEKYPNIKLKAQANAANNWAAFFDQISTQIAGGKIPDLIQVATEGQRLFASRGLVEPIDDVLERDKEELADFFADIHPNLVTWNQQHSSPDGKTYYLPGEFNTMCVWYNIEVLQKAGVEEPTDDWTWDDFLAAGQKIAGTGVFGMHVEPAYFVGIMPWLLTNGASTLNDDWTQATVNTPAAIESASFMRSLVEQKISPEPGGTFDQFTAMAQGKLAMFGGGRWPVINMRNLNAIDKIKIVAWPQKTQKGSPIGWNAYPIMKGTKNKEAAWAFVKFIASKEASEYFAQQGGTIVPPRRSVANSDAFLANAPVGSEKLYAALDYSTPIPSPDKGNVVQKAIEDAWKQILSGNAKPEDALGKLNEDIQSNL